jgi:hypothetical protein
MEGPGDLRRHGGPRRRHQDLPPRCFLLAVLLRLLPSRHGPVVREARALCRVEHPGVVRFYTLHLDDDAGLLGLVMEFLDGRSLETRASSASSWNSSTVAPWNSASGSRAPSPPRRPSTSGSSSPRPSGRCMRPGLSTGISSLPMGSRSAAPTSSSTLALPPTRPRPLPPLSSGLSLTTSPSRLLARASPSSATPPPSMEPSLPPRAPSPAAPSATWIPHSLATGASATPASDPYGLGVVLFESLTGRLPSCSSGGGLRGEILDGRVAPESLLTLSGTTPAPLASLVDALPWG